MSSHHPKGTLVTHTEHSKTNQLLRTGSFGVLRGFLRSKGRDGRSSASSRPCGASIPRFSLAAGLLLLALGFLPAVAQAQPHKTHVFSTSFGEFGSGAGQFSFHAPNERGTVSGLAVNDTTGDVYVADRENHRVDQFSSAGSFIRAWGWEVNAKTPEPKLQTCTTATGCQVGVSGGAPGAFEAPARIAVDNDPTSPSLGDVYVGDIDNQVISKFTSSGGLIEAWGVNGQLNGSTATDGPFGLLAGLLVDPAGNLDVLAGDEKPFIYRFAQDGTFLTDFSTTKPIFTSSFALAPGGDFFDAKSNGEAQQLNPAGTEIGLLTAPNQTDVTGLAADAATGDLYAANQNFYPSKEGPNPQVYDFTFNGSGEVIEPSGATCQPTPAGQGCQPIDAFGLGRLASAYGVAVNSANHLVYVADATAEHVLAYRPVLLPEATTAAATEVTTTSAQLHGAVNPEELETSYQFEWGTELPYSHREPAEPAAVGNDNTAHPESASLTNLTPDTVYHYRIDAVNEALLAEGVPLSEAARPGTDFTFRTSGPPTIDSQSVHQPTGTSTAKIETKINPSGFDTHYRIEYGPTAAYGSQTAPIDIGESSADQELTAELTGLHSGTTYHYRVLAENSQGQVESPYDQIFTTENALRIDSVSATEVGPTTATLNAQINPLGHESFYHFEYDTNPYALGEAPHGTQVPPADEPLGNGSTDVSVAQPISGLQPNTTYYYRVVAHNSLGTETSVGHTFIDLTEPGPQPETPCPDEALRTGLSAHLPDCRVYEQVSPPSKNGALFGVSFFAPPASISADGSTLAGFSIQCTPGSTSCDPISGPNEGSPAVAVFFERSASGWLTTQFAPPATSFERSQFIGYDASLDVALIQAPAPLTGKQTFYKLTGDGTLVEVGPDLATTGDDIHGLFTRASADLSHLVVQNQGENSPYEYVDGDSASIPVTVGGPADGPGSTDQICQASEGNGRLVNAISSNGRIVIFQAGPCEGGTGANAGTKVPSQELFARVDGESEGAHTVTLSARSSTECSGACISSHPDNASFIGTSDDGTMVYFTSNQQLTDAASEGSANLYLYDSGAEAGHNLIDVSAGDTSGFGPQVQRVFAISPDGSHAYFLAHGVLAGANPEGNAPSAGAENLYAYQRDPAHPSGQISFIATLPGSVAEGDRHPSGEDNVSPDGRYLVFTSAAPLTPDLTKEGPAQVFRYDATAERLIRVSIGERGFGDNGTLLAASDGVALDERSHSFLLGKQSSSPTMSADASRIFFTSAAALTPGALDDVQIGSGAIGEGSAAYASNIYEWEQQGTGGCTEASGCVSLISDGRDTSRTIGSSSVKLVGTNPSGSDVFFTTADSLLPSDTDTALDYYDARTDGGFAEPPQPVSCQTSDACHLGTTQPAVEQSPATPGFNGKEEGPKFPQKSPKHRKKRHPKKHHKPKKHSKRAGSKPGGQK
jgi:hypothetical protein